MTEFYFYTFNNIYEIIDWLDERNLKKTDYTLSTFSLYVKTVVDLIIFDNVAATEFALTFSDYFISDNETLLLISEIKRYNRYIDTENKTV